MTINTKYEIGDIVFLKTDPDQLERMVFKFTVYRNETLIGLACGCSVSDHYDFEISAQKDLLKELNISGAQFG